MSEKIQCLKRKGGKISDFFFNLAPLGLVIQEVVIRSLEMGG
jgi:hypothetical protein